MTNASASLPCKGLIRSHESLSKTDDQSGINGIFLAAVCSCPDIRYILCTSANPWASCRPGSCLCCQAMSCRLTRWATDLLVYHPKLMAHRMYACSTALHIT